ncbi:hypothetical protein FDUTEX481_03377 [Tolypothrix sp. PCC 7601]|nr:hypothetical protein FDUTEX481_03377 [Tolypothrix sp. PCC 7601]BAY94606.1 hypothetical protein NIES3275_66580 [Microchaete diplosiphon NIES-3275]
MENYCSGIIISNLGDYGQLEESDTLVFPGLVLALNMPREDYKGSYWKNSLN